MPDAHSPGQTSIGRVSTRSLGAAGVAALAIAAVVVGVGVFSRVQADKSLKAWTQGQEVPTVALAVVGGSGQQDLTLPANIAAFNTAAIHSRVPGYLKRWYVDIGAPVKTGQLLAEIDTPELDQQVVQARADLATAQAAQKLSQITAERYAALLAKGFATRQDADEKQGDLAVKTSAVNSAKANLDRLIATSSFKRITAPFDGQVTSRSTDIGALIAVGGATDPALFTIADQHRLRVYVRVPQVQTSLVRKGMTAKVTVPEYPGESFPAVVVSDAGAVNAANGAVLTELQLDNAQGRLKGGAYAEVNFDLKGAQNAAQQAGAVGPVSIPSTAVLYRNNGPAVVVMGREDKVRIVPIVIQRDLGATVEVGAGVTGADRIVDNPPEGLGDGDKVRVVAKSAAARKG